LRALDITIALLGIARCFTYGGSRCRAIFDPAVPPITAITQEQYAQQKNAPRCGALPTPLHAFVARPVATPLHKHHHSVTVLTRFSLGSINHFYEKLLKLKGMMKSVAGKKRAEGRHEFMETYLEQFYSEWRGDC
jgi:uncharacterized protein